MSVIIALPTTRIPKATSPLEEVIAIIDIRPERAQELLELMETITGMAAASSRAFKISSFEACSLYVPRHALSIQPPGNDYIVLPEDYTVTEVTEVKVVHADVMPLCVTWEAYDQDERFKLTTAELDAEVLKLIARGERLAPGSTSSAVKNGTRPQAASSSSKALFIPHKNRYVM